MVLSLLFESNISKCLFCLHRKTSVSCYWVHSSNKHGVKAARQAHTIPKKLLDCTKWVNWQITCHYETFFYGNPIASWPTTGSMLIGGWCVSSGCMFKSRSTEAIRKPTPRTTHNGAKFQVLCTPALTWNASMLGKDSTCVAAFKISTIAACTYPQGSRFSTA